MNEVSAAADTIYVSGSGNDSWDGQSPTHQSGISGPKLSIKNATGSVQENGTVYVGDGKYSGVNNNNITIDKNMAIIGHNKELTIINGTDSNWIFHINSGVTVLLGNLTLTNGLGVSGGAISNDGTLSITNSTITRNNAEGIGGAIFNKGALYIDRSSLTFNTASEDYGGAILNQGNLVMHFNRIAGNSQYTIYNNGMFDGLYNWWGSNSNPSSQFYNLGTITYSPWIFMTVASDHSIIPKNGVCKITANLNNAFDGSTITPLDPSLGNFPDETLINFSTTLGSVNNSSYTMIGIASSTLNGGTTTGTADVSATLDSQILHTSINIDADAPTASANPEGRIYNSAKNVELTMNKPGTIYYTLDGSDPTTSSSVYIDPITINRDTILKFIAIDQAGNLSPIYTESYTIDTIPPTISANPQAGRYNSTKLVTLTMNKPGTIYYTINGTTPTQNSHVYVNPITINVNTVLTFTAFDLAGNQSLIYYYYYTIDTVPPYAYASPNGGYFNSPQTVYLHMDKPGTIYYTLDGSDPTTSSSVYVGPLTIDRNTILKLLAVDLSGNKATESYNFVIDTTIPVLNATPTAGLYNCTQLVALNMNKAGTIYYTLDGSDPTTSSPVYSNPLTINVNNTILKFMGIDLAGNQSLFYWYRYLIDTTPPNGYSDLPSGYYNTSKTIGLYMDKEGTIYYTLDGSTPTNSSSVYIGRLSIDRSTVVKFLTMDRAGNKAFYTYNYIIDTVPPTVSSNPKGGLYNVTKIVNLTMNKPGTIYYTLNGTDPSQSSLVYINPITINSNTTLKFIAFDLAGNPSQIYSETYNFDTTAPTARADPEGGIYNTTKTVTLTMNKPGTIYYTLNGTDPTIFSSIYVTPIVISSSTTLKFLAVDIAGNPSLIYTEKYNIDTTPPTVRANPNGGIYNTIKTVNLIMNKEGTIYYTLNGTDPSQSSFVYINPITINSNTTLKFMAVDLAGNPSQIFSETYKFDRVAPIVKAIDPVNGALNVKPDKVIKITFSKPVKLGINPWIELKNGMGTLHVKTAINGNVLTITHPSKLSNGQYILILHTGCVVDFAGNSLGYYLSKFKVNGTTPSVLSTIPSHLEINVSKTSGIAVKFSKSIQKSSNFNGIKIKNLSNNTYLPSKIAINGDMMYFNTAKRNSSTWYQVVIPANAVKDDANNNLKLMYSFKFKTKA